MRRTSKLKEKACQNFLENPWLFVMQKEPN
jgi:hypothetical protein